MRTITCAFGIFLLLALTSTSRVSSNNQPSFKTQDDFALTKVAEGVYGAIAKPGGLASGNAGFVVGDEGVLVVDTFFTPVAAEELIDAIGVETKQPIKYAVNTHYHLDHTGGNQVFAGLSIPIIGHDNLIAWQTTKNRRFLPASDELQKLPQGPSPTSQETAAQSETLDLGLGAELSGRQALFGIIQGAGHLPLRKESLARTVEIGFDGYAIGGLSVGEEKQVMYDVIEFIAPQMPIDSPRYLMGVGTPEDLIEAVHRGVDMFDCVLPTRNGRTGGAFTSRGRINIRNAKFATDDGPLDADCGCSVCRRYSRAYLRHLYQAGEMLAATLISHHNLAFFLDTMRQVRQSIKLGLFSQFRLDYLNKLRENDASGV